MYLVNNTMFKFITQHEPTNRSNGLMAPGVDGIWGQKLPSMEHRFEWSRLLWVYFQEFGYEDSAGVLQFLLPVLGDLFKALRGWDWHHRRVVEINTSII